MTETEDRWQWLGRLMLARRVALGYPQRNTFAKDKGFKNPRVIAAIENAERTNFSSAMLASFEIAYEWERGSIASVLDGGEPSERPHVDPTTGVDASENIMQRLTREADEAQAVFEAAADALVAAEFAADAANDRIFRHMAMLEKLIEARDAREKRLGRPLTNRELYALEGVERPSALELSHYSVGYASNDPHEHTRYEIALMIEIDGWDYDMAVAGSRYMEMTLAHEKASKLAERIKREEGEEDGTQEPPQKTELDERRGRRESETSDEDDKVLPAADDAVEGVDEKPGGSDTDES